MSVVSSVCCYCGTGCGVLIETGAGKITGVRGDPAHPANRGKLCTKGATLALSAAASGRVLYPELRTEKGAPRRRVVICTCSLPFGSPSLPTRRKV